jgi:carboxyl-terminal processing protease
MKTAKSLMLAAAMAASVFSGGQALAADPYPYCKLLTVPPPAKPGEPEQPNPLKELLKTTTNASEIVDKLLDPVAPLKPEDLQGIYTQVFNTIASKYIDISKLDRLAPLQHKFDGKLNTRADLNKAVSELITTMDDRWTWVTSAPDKIDAVMNYLSKQNSLGINVRKGKDGNYFVEHISYGSGAQMSGFREGDVILSVNDKDIASLSKAEADKLFIGPIGNSIKVKSVQDGKTVEGTYMVRPPVANEAEAKLLEKNIAYVKLPSFMSEEDFQEMLGSLIDMAQKTPGGVQGAVLDLRYNGGGSVDMAKTLIKFLLTDGIAIHETSRDGDTLEDTTTTILPIGPFTKLRFSPEQIAVLKDLKSVPLVVLVNGSSASASEIVTGALKESRPNTTVVGEQSFGKFEEMIVMSLPDCSQVAVTSGRYTTPTGKWLHNVGITPDIVVHQPRDSQDDAQMAAAIKLLEDKTGLNPANIVGMEPSKQPAMPPVPDRASPEVPAFSLTQMISDYRVQIMQGGVGAVLLGFLGLYLLLSRKKKED